MKHSLILCVYGIIAAFLFISCQKQTFVLEGNFQGHCYTTRSSVEDTLCETHVTEKMALFYVSKYLMNKEIDSVEPFVIDGDTLLYGINFEKGWTIISADTRTDPVLADSEYGSLSFEEDKALSRIWLETMAERILSLDYDKQIKEDPDVQKTWNSIRNVVHKTWIDKLSGRRIPTRGDEVENPGWVKVILSAGTQTTITGNLNHLIQTKWGQEYPWNTNVIHSGVQYPAGCVAVAMGQVMYYYHNFLDNPSGAFSGLYETVYYTGCSNYVIPSSRWDSMKMTASSAGNASYVSDLLMSICVLNNNNTQFLPTGTYMSTDTTTFLNCGIRVSKSDYDFETVVDELDDGHPVIVRATIDPVDIHGHCWIIDGYQSRRVESTTVYGYYFLEDVTLAPVVFSGYDIESYYSQEEMDSLYPGAVNGSQETFYYVRNYNNLRMNWGYDGNGDDALYSDYPNWPYQYSNGTYVYKYNSTIYYGFTAL